MQKPVLVGLSPNKLNIKYSIKPPIKADELCNQLADDLLSNRTQSPKIVVFLQITTALCRYPDHYAKKIVTRFAKTVLMGTQTEQHFSPVFDG